VGTGVSNQTFGVFSFGVHDDALIVGGDFKNAGGVPAKAIARWDGTTWSALGVGMTDWRPGFFPTVHSMAVFNGDLIAGGDFTLADGDTAKFVARWDGTSWNNLGLGTTALVYDVIVYNQKLVVGGFFSTAGGMTVNRLASWDGASWSSFGSGMEGWVDALAVYQGSLYAGGNFNWAGLKSSLGIARWTDPTSSVIEPPRVQGLAAYPNPFKSRTMFAYELPLPGSYRLMVYDVQGRRVRALADAFLESGPMKFLWDGNDETGTQVKEGVYFVRLSGPAGSHVMKVVLQP
jgi:hypothetical protein